MADVLTKEQRSYNMSRIRSSKTKPELKIKKLMKKIGFGYHLKNIEGNPDFADRNRKIAVFIDGCFWHACPEHYKEPKSNATFWSKKIKQNKARDEKVNGILIKSGWQVIRLWEHDLK